MTLPSRTSVLVSGGGPVGLAAAIELGRRGIATMVIEPRATVSHARPRCKTLNVRTMEHLRRWGIADRVRARCPLATSWSQDIVFCTSLAGYELSRFEGALGLVPDGERFAELGQQAPQYVFEEVLREVVAELDACTLVPGARVADMRQSPDEVTVSVETEQGMAEVLADYVLGCDGAHSVVREAMGAVYEGEDATRPNVGMVFRAPELWRHVAVGRAVHYHIVNGEAPGLLGPLDLDGTWWIICFGVEAERAEQAGEQLIAAAVGRSVELEIVSRDPWNSRMRLVDRLRVGRVFLAGDAAHLNPPHGGHGLNVGIGDAADLGWKLAAVLDGWADPDLLDSYEAERRPFQARIIDEATENMRVLGPELVVPDLATDTPAGQEARRRTRDRIQSTKRRQFHALDLVLDWNYEDAEIATDRTRPGTRLPHAWLGTNHSLFDELGDGLTLLLLAESGEAGGGIVGAARSRGVPLRVADLRPHALADRYGAGWLLVRSDQHIAARGDEAPADPGALLDRFRGRGVKTPA